MKRRLSLIFGLLVGCLLGSYGFQAYWLYGSYQLAKAQFERTVREALDTVVQRQLLGTVTKTFNIKINNYSNPHEPTNASHRWHIERVDTGLIAAPTHQRPTTGLITQVDPDNSVATPNITTPPQVLVFQAPPPPPVAQQQALARVEQARTAHTDSMARKLSAFVVHDWYLPQDPDLVTLCRVYQVELSRRQIAQSFRLDTVTDATRWPAMATQTGFVFHTPAVQLNPVRGVWVVASFRPPTTYVLQSMAGSLAGSLTLLLLTTGCLGLMLHTILGQKKLAEVKNDFIHNMTHELKTPLATVAAAVEALQDFGALRDPQRTNLYLTIARQETARLGSLVDNVLRIAMEERRGYVLTLQPEPVRLAELVTDAVYRHQQLANKPVQVKVDIAPTELLMLDRLHLTGVLDNLLDNAIKYSGEQVCIRITGLPAPGGGWQLTVADNGLGIAPDYQAAVFEQFFRVPTGNLHPVKGFGLGLYYAQQVVTSHGGKLTVRSEIGSGSEFIIWLPSERQLTVLAEN